MDYEEFEYRGFRIRYTSKIIKRRLIDYMYTSRKVFMDGEFSIVSISGEGTTFEEAMQNICSKIDVFLDRYNNTFSS